ncbi:MAG TPA: protein translocase subunit SecD [Moraxellaceae bacterium]|nr:protein translocase subunit SecD [Moraxellaceae bacterium]
MRVSLWKSLLILVVLVVSVLYSLPNLYPDEPALQVTGANASVPVDQSVLENASRALTVAGIPFHDAAILGRKGKESVLLRVNNTADQLHAQDVLRRELGDKYVAALNLAPTTPAWLTAIRATPMKLGLDLRGGVHFLLEVDMSKALEQRQESYITDMKARLREKKLAYRSIGERGQGFTLKFEKADERQKAEELLKSEFNEFTYARRDTPEGFFTDLDFTPAKLRELSDYAVNQNLTTIRNRVNELGVAEPLVQRQGMNRIVVELPGIQDTAEAKRILGRTASLEFRMVDPEHSEAVGGIAPPGSEVYPFKDNREPPVVLLKRKIVTGDRVVNAQSSFDEFSNPKVDITLDSRGGKLMADATQNNVGRQMAVLFVESRQQSRMTTDESGKQVEVKQNVTEKYVINRATIQSMLGSRFQITGLDSPAEAAELALLLRAGALAAPMYFVEERTIGPSLGAENIRRGVHATLWGFLAIALFMIVYYQVFGVISVVALAFNLVFLTALLGFLGATLTLPGIAAIALALGMAIDANVLINERIREELRNGAPPRTAITVGYERAFGTIVDSNVTTFIVGLMLLLFGSGPVRGFAVVHCLGILTSIFSAVVLSRALVDLIYGGRARLTSLAIGQVWKPKSATTPGK